MLRSGEGNLQRVLRLLTGLPALHATPPQAMGWHVSHNTVGSGDLSSLDSGKPMASNSGVVKNGVCC